MKTRLPIKLLVLGLFTSFVSLQLNAQQTFDFETSGDTEGFTKAYGFATLSQGTESGRGVLIFEHATLNFPTMNAPAIDANANKLLRVVLKNASDAYRIRLFFGGNVEGEFPINEGPVASDYNTYLYDLNTIANWTGNINDLDIQIMRAGGGDPVTGTVYIDEISFLEYDGGDTFSGLLQNPGFDDAIGSLLPWNPQAKAYLNTNRISADVVHDGIQSVKFEYTGPNSGNDFIFNNFYTNATVNGEEFTVKAELYVKYKNSLGVPATKDINMFCIWIPRVGTDASSIPFADRPKQIVTHTLDNDGAWVKYEFSQTVSGLTFDNINMQFAVQAGSAMEEYDILYVDSAAACINCPSLSTENIIKDDTSLKLYPNPVRDILNVSSTGTGIDKIEIYSVLGKRVLSTYETESISVVALTPGIYISKVYRDNEVSTKRFIKE